MTPTDELWIDMAQFDTEVADGIWDGAVPPDDAPGWWSEIASLARTARERQLPAATVIHTSKPDRLPPVFYCRSCGGRTTADARPCRSTERDETGH